MRVLFVEPFYGGSHRTFADGLVRHSAHDIELLTLPEGEWRRRMRLGAQELALAAGALEGEFDALVATDMLDVPLFLALTRPRFERVRVLYYLHENQFTYPRLRGTKLNSWFGQINYVSALAAERVAFNSEFHREDFLAALRTLGRQPNNWLAPAAADAIEAKSGVLPVGVDLEWLDAHQVERDRTRPPLLLWNHRWEFDKAPEVFARAVTALAAEGLAFRVAIAGEPGPNPSPALPELAARFPALVERCGYIERREEYARLLWQSDIVVSTSRQEFFGVAMVEALHCGCFPVAPAGLNYPSLVPAEMHERCLFGSEAELLERLRTAIIGPRGGEGALRASAARFAWEKVAPQWDVALAALALEGGQ
ncbi:MAG: tRNA-queuosine alpha-mannosyltransferase domain-containing protein [Tepidiformaceae bacterium]